MKTRLIIAAAMALVLGLSSLALAGSTATQSVTYEVQAINEISVSGDPGSLIINTATAGSEPNDATDNSTTYAITTNGSNKKITGEIDTAMPTDVTLKVNLQAPTGGTSAGAVTLTSTAADLVTGISTVAQSGLTITYTLSATVDAGVVASASKTVTLTIIDGV
jgi:hypothetical protein